MCNIIYKLLSPSHCSGNHVTLHWKLMLMLYQSPCILLRTYACPMSYYTQPSLTVPQHLVLARLPKTTWLVIWPIRNAKNREEWFHSDSHHTSSACEVSYCTYRTRYYCMYLILASALGHTQAMLHVSWKRLFCTATSVCTSLKAGCVLETRLLKYHTYAWPDLV